MSRTNTGVVLMYHSVSAPRFDPFSLCASPENFEQHLDVLGEIADVVPLRSIFEGGSRVAITFDDGYRDNLDAAHPLLKSAGMPATVFVTSDLLTTTGPLWWDRLAHLVLEHEPRRPVLELEVDGASVPVDLSDVSGRERALNAVQSLLRARPAVEVEAVVEAVADQLGEPETEPEYPAFLDEAGARELARDGLVDIGGHTRSHSMLSGQKGPEQWSEISGCKQELERVLDRPVTTFAYPYGNRRSYTPMTAWRVKRAGFELACTTREKPIRRTTMRYRVPRIAVRNWDRERFTREVRRALDGDE